MGNYKHLTFYLFILVFAINTGNQYAQEISKHKAQEKLFDKNFKENYSGRKFNYEGSKTIGTTASRSGDYTDFKNDEKNPNIEEENNRNDPNFGNSFGFLNWIFILALILAVLYLIYILLGEENLGLFKRTGNREIGIPENFTAENIADTDVSSLIAAAERNNDFRLAIRYYYILVLKELSLKDFIKLEEDKTNAEYFNEIQSEKFSENFAYTSYLYNYIWYGEFLINNQEYSKAKDHFIHLIKKIGR